MGAYQNGDASSLSPLSDFDFSSSRALRFSKHVHDNVHGNIFLDPVFLFLTLFILFYSLGYNVS